MPSFFEGIPVVGIEAQFAGLPCFFSDGVPKEVEFNNKCRFIPLKSGCDEWVYNIMLYNKDRRVNNSDKENIYDISNSSILLSEYYEMLLREI